MKSIFNIIIILFLPILLFQSCDNPPPEISQWRGPDRNGIYPETGLLKEWPEDGPDLVWEYNELGNGYSSAAATSEKVYTVGTIDSISYIFTFNHNGELLWKKELGKEWMTNFPGMRSTPLIIGTEGYILNGLGDLFCFNTETGNIIWNKNIIEEYEGKNNRFGITENLLFDGDRIFCTPGGEENNIICLDRFTGELLWTSKGSEEVSAYCSPGIYELDGKKYFTTVYAESIIAIDIETGETAWKYVLEGGSDIHSNIPVFNNGNLFVMADYRIGSVMLQVNDSGRSVEEVWKMKYLDTGLGDVVHINNYLYGTSNHKKHFVAVDWQTGEVVDSVKTELPLTVFAADDMLYTYSFKGKVSLIGHDSTGLKIHSSFQFPGGKEHFSQPIIHEKRLYIRNDSTLKVYDIKEKGIS